MAAFHGKGGSVTFAASGVDNVLSWTVTAEADVEDATAMGATWKTYLAGFSSWTAKVEAELDDSGLDPDLATDLVDDDGAALVLNTGNTGSGEIDYWTGTAIVTNIVPGADADGVQKVTYEFQGSGALTAHQHA